MRKSVLLTILIFSLTHLSAQTVDSDHSSYKTYQGNQLLHAGVGFLNPTAFSFSIFSANGGGNPSVSANLNYQYALTQKFLVGVFGSYYRVDANFDTSFEELDVLFEDITFDDFIQNIDCIALGNCSTTISERVSVYSLGLKLSYTKRIIQELETYLSGYAGYSFNIRKTITESALNLVSEELDLNVEVPTFIYYSSVGLRYYLTERLALQAEYGYGNSHLLNVGLTMKLSSTR